MQETKYETRINEIIGRYCKPLPKTELEEISGLQRLKELIALHGDEPWAIWGAGRAVNILWEAEKFTESETFQGYFDSNQKLWGQEFCGSTIKASDSLRNTEIKTIFLCVLRFFPGMKEQIESINPQILVIDLYQPEGEIYEYNGYRVGRCDSITSHSGYDATYVFYQLYCQTEDLSLKKKYLELLISAYAEIRDFINLFNQIQLYLTEFGTGHYDLFQEELERLLSDLQLDLRQRKGKDILFVLLDNLSAENCYENPSFSYINHLAKEGIQYTHAYSSGVFTSESTSAMWRETPVVKLKRKDSSDSVLLKEALQKNMYRSFWVGPRKIKLIFPQDEVIMYQKDGLIFDKSLFKRELPNQYWQALTYFAEGKEQCFSMIHAITETHHPYRCGNYGTIVEPLPIPHVQNRTHRISMRDKRKPTVYSYVDQQSEFYLSMLSEETIKVIFADHGGTVDSGFYHSIKFHVPLIIQGTDIPPQRNNQLFSTLYLPQLVEGLMQGKIIRDVNCNYVQVGQLKIRNEATRKEFIEAGFNYEVSGFNLFLNKEYKMIRNGEGEFRYFLMENEEEQVTDPEIIKKIKERFGHLFEDEDIYSESL